MAIQSFFDKGFFPNGINSTILALIPKYEATTVRELSAHLMLQCHLQSDLKDLGKKAEISVTEIHN